MKNDLILDSKTIRSKLGVLGSFASHVRSDLTTGLSHCKLSGVAKPNYAIKIHPKIQPTRSAINLLRVDWYELEGI